MPRSTSTHVRDKEPAIPKEAAKLAEEFYGVRNWNYSIQNVRPSQRIFKPPQETPLSTIPQDSTSNNKPATTPSQVQNIILAKKKVHHILTKKKELNALYAMSGGIKQRIVPRRLELWPQASSRR